MQADSERRFRQTVVSGVLVGMQDTVGAKLS